MYLLACRKPGRRNRLLAAEAREHGRSDTRDAERTRDTRRGGRVHKHKVHDPHLRVVSPPVTAHSHYAILNSKFSLSSHSFLMLSRITICYLLRDLTIVRIV